jgi:cytochrome o ubiquinol oxidase subunit 3
MTTATPSLHQEHHQYEIYSRTILGFWLYLMTDCILFATLFAAYAVLHNHTFGGPTSQELFNPSYALIETLILLTSSFVCGLAVLMAHRHQKNKTLIFFGLTFLLGLSFLGLEIREFHQLVQEGHDWQRSAFLSSYFTLVGTHGLHITFGLLWMIVMMVLIFYRGLHIVNLKKLMCLGLFWHFLDVIWIFIFTIVYLMGVIK